MIRRLTVLAIAMMAIVASSTLRVALANGPSYTIEPLPNGYIARAINDKGETAGYRLYEDGSSRPAKTTRRGALRLLAKDGQATDIANDGTVVGWSYASLTIWSGKKAEHPVVDGQSSYGQAISPNGTYVVGNMITPNGDGIENVAVKFIKLPTGWSAGIIGRGWTQDVNNGGTVVGQSESGAPQIFGQPYGEETGSLVAINDNGIAVGGTDGHPLVAWPDGNWTVGSAEGVYYDINNANDIVGEESGMAVVKYDGGESNPLQWLLTVPRDKRQWRLDTAYAINTAGDIVGLGVFKGKTRGFLLRNRAAARLAPQ